MLYEQYGWSAAQIGALLGIPSSVISVHVDSSGLVPYAPSNSTVDLDADKTSVAQLKSAEIYRQQQIVPIMAVIEISLLEKIKGLVDSIDDPKDVAAVVKADKQLTQDSITNTVAHAEEITGNKSPQIAIQILNEVQ